MEQLTPIKRALLEIRELRTRLQQAEGRHREPIAIIGLGLRFPGGATDLPSFWQVLAQGKDAISEIPPGRWDRDFYFDPDPDQPGKMNVRHGGFIDGVDQFDAEFFSISPREAASMDPQQRVLLEVCWEALEQAGESAASLANSQTAVFIGMANGDYLRMLYADREQIDTYAASGNGFSLASGRLSYLLGAHGPSVTIDTACSSSLVALHLACQSLRLGESHIALAGGVNLILSPELNINLSKVRVLAPDGRCKSFSAAADGYGRSEGCGIAVLKPLSAALADRNRILAVIRGSAVNQDGRSAGITAPNGPAQEAVIRSALKSAGLSPQDVTYVEAHGTGTALGDPIEVQALAAALGQGRSPGRPLLIGAVKTNVGHLEAAAGMTGLAKAILVLQHQAIPPTLHLRDKNPAVDWESLPISIPTELTPWPDNAPRVIGLSSFGMSGTNAHVLLEAAPVQQKMQNDPERPMHLLTLSACNETAVCDLAARYERFLAETDDDIADVCFTANAGRSHFAYRLAVAGENTAEIRSGLAGLIANPRLGEATSRPRIAFVFTGQGPQYPHMGAELYRTSPTFRAAIDECEELLRPYVDRRLTEILFPVAGDEFLIDKTNYAQPAIFALEYALSQLWRSWGIKPDLVTGHSLGEFAAACAAGIFTLDDGLRLVSTRGRLIGSLPPDGGMVAVFAQEPRVRAAIAPYANRIAIGAINGPDNIVVSGGCAELDLLTRQLQADGIQFHRLNVSNASHSPLLEPILDEFEAVAQSVSYMCPKVGFISNATGTLIDADKPLPGSYWRNHLRGTVRFAAGLETLYDQGVRHFLELGPKPVLGAVGMDSHATECKWYGSLTPLRRDWAQMLESLQSLYLEGVSVDWPGFDHDYVRNKISAPTYPFQRQSYWKTDSRPSGPPVRSVEPAMHSAAPPATDWFYQVKWQPVRTDGRAAGSRPGSEAPRKSWIVFCGTHPVGSTVSEGLRRRGCSVATVSAGHTYARENNHFTIDPAHPEDFERAIHEAGEGSASEILFLWGLDLGKVSGTGNVAEETAAMCTRAVYALRGAVAQPGSRLWFVTGGAQAEGQADAPIAEQASLWGLGRTVSLEQPEAWGGLLDLDPQSDPEQQAESVIGNIVRADGEDQVIVRNGARLAGRLVHASLHPSSTFSARPDGSYLITGGLGGLGPEIARWLVERGATHVVLTGRRGLPDRSCWAAHDRASDIGHSIAAVEALEALGARVEPVSADVTVRPQMEALFSRFGAEWPPLRGIVHAAVSAAASAVNDLNEAKFMQMFSAKLAGTQHLLALGSKHPLDFLALYSSLAGVIGSSGGAHYSAASAYLDAVAHVGRSQGVPVVSVAWGAWEQMRNASEEVRNRFRAGGLIPMSFHEGLDALGRVIMSGYPEVTVADVDWERLRAAYELRRSHPLLGQLGTETKISPAARPREQSQEFREQLEHAAPNQRRGLVLAFIRTAVAAVLGARDPAALNPGKGLFQMGMDSLMSVDLKRRLEAGVGQPLPSTLIFNYPNITALTEYLLRDALGFAESKVNAASPHSQVQGKTGLTDGVALSEEKLAELLRKKLKQLAPETVSTF